jgi:hypothetical protein
MDDAVSLHMVQRGERRTDAGPQRKNSVASDPWLFAGGTRRVVRWVRKVTGLGGGQGPFPRMVHSAVSDDHGSSDDPRWAWGRKREKTMLHLARGLEAR